VDIPTTVALVGVVGGLILATYTYWEARKSNRLSVLAGFFKEYRDLEPQRYFVLNVMPSREVVPISGLREWDRQNVVVVAYYLDALALLADKGLVKESDIMQLLGGSIQRQYEALCPFIEKEREARKEEVYMRGFEHLAALAKRHEPIREQTSPPEYEHLLRFPCPKSD
jgi:hypothetical protein